MKSVFLRKISILVMTALFMLAAVVVLSGTAYAEETGQSEEESSQYTEIITPDYDTSPYIFPYFDFDGTFTDYYFTKMNKGLIARNNDCTKAVVFNRDAWEAGYWSTVQDDALIPFNEVFKTVDLRQVSGANAFALYCTADEISNSYMYFEYNEDKTAVAIYYMIDGNKYVLEYTNYNDGCMVLQRVEGNGLIYERKKEIEGLGKEQTYQGIKFEPTYFKIKEMKDFYGIVFFKLYYKFGYLMFDEDECLKVISEEAWRYKKTDDEDVVIEDTSEMKLLLFTSMGDTVKGVKYLIPSERKYTDSCYYDVMGATGSFYTSTEKTCIHTYSTTDSDKNNTFRDEYIWYCYEQETGKDYSEVKAGYFGVRESEAKFSLQDAVETIENNQVQDEPVVTVKDVYKASETQGVGWSMTVTVYEHPLWEDTAPNRSSYVLYSYTQYPLYVDINGMNSGDECTTLTGSCISEKLTKDCVNTFKSGDYVMSGNWVAYKLPNKYKAGADYHFDWSSLKITDLSGHVLNNNRIAIKLVTIGDDEYLYLYDMPDMGIKISIDVTGANTKFSAKDFNNYAYASNVPCIEDEDYPYSTDVLVDIHQQSITLSCSDKNNLTGYAITSPEKVAETDPYEEQYSHSVVWYMVYNQTITEIGRGEKINWTLPDYNAGTEIYVFCETTKTYKNASRTKTSNNIHIKYTGYEFQLEILDMNSEDNETDTLSDRILIAIDKETFSTEYYDKIFNDIKHLYVTDEAGNTVEVTKKLGYTGNSYLDVADEYTPIGEMLSHSSIYYYSQAFVWTVPAKGTYTFKAEMSSGYLMTKTVTFDYLSTMQVLDCSNQDVGRGSDMVYFSFTKTAYERIQSFEMRSYSDGNYEWKSIDKLGYTTVFGDNNTTYTGYLFRYEVKKSGSYEFRFKDNNGCYFTWIVYYRQISNTHTHNLVHVDASGAATCTTPQTKEYYYCTGCERIYSDANGENEISSYSDLVIQKALGHNYVWDGTEATRVHVAASCSNYEYYDYTKVCSRCQAVTVQRDFLGDSLVHTYTWVAVDESVHSYECTQCGEYYWADSLHRGYRGANGELLEAHSYDDDSDTTCNVCGYTRYLPSYKYVKSGTEYDTPENTLVHDVKTAGSQWGAGWYIAKDTTTIDYSIQITGDVNLILADGCNLTINAAEDSRTDSDGVEAAIEVAKGCTLTIYAQSAETGKLTVINKNRLGAAIGASSQTDSGTIKIYGGNITINCNSGKYLGLYVPFVEYSESQTTSYDGASEGVFVDAHLGLYRMNNEVARTHGIDTDISTSPAVNSQNSELGYTSLIIKPKVKYISVTKDLSYSQTYGELTNAEYLLDYSGFNSGLTLSNTTLRFYTDSSYSTELSENVCSSYKLETDAETGNLKLVITPVDGLDAGTYYFAVVHTEDSKEYLSQGSLLFVEKREITLSSSSLSKVYDGSPLSGGSVTITSGSFAAGEGFDFTLTGQQLTAGTNKNIFVYELEAGTNAENYEITCEYGTLEVKQIEAPVVITAGSAEMTYTGTALECDEYTYTQDVLISGDVLTVKCSGTITDVGTAKNTVKSYMVTRDGIDVTDSYTFGKSVDGTLTVTKANNYNIISLETESETVPGKKNGKIYPVTTDMEYRLKGESSYTEITDDMLSDDVLSVGKGTYEIRYKEDNNYFASDVTEVTVKLETKPIIITAGSATKTYDGTALKCSEFTYDTSLLLEGDVLKVILSGEITEAGTAENKVVAYKILRNGEDVTSLYTFGTPVSGTLTVEAVKSEEKQEEETEPSQEEEKKDVTPSQKNEDVTPSQQEEKEDVTPSQEDKNDSKPVITDGNGGEYTTGSEKDSDESEGLSFGVETSGSFSISVDGKEITEEDYTVSEDGKEIILNPEFLDTLEEGEHTLEITSPEGTASATFTVNGADEEDENRKSIIPTIVVSAGAATTAGCSYYFIFRKKETVLQNKK